MNNNRQNDQINEIKTAHGKRQTENEKRKKKSIVAAILAQAIEIIF